MKNKKLIFGFGMIFLMSILLIGFVSAAESYCCEKTTTGAWCQNAEEDSCDIEFRKAPTSCESTSYCKQGCCYNSDEGTCMENTPQIICQENNGVWESDEECNIPQCELGCCLIGGQAAFVSQTRCKRLSSLYGLEVNFRSEIKTEIECIQSITSEAEGACIFEEEFERTCVRTAKNKCLKMEKDVEFYEGFLCSADDLNTICGSSKKTTCIEREDAVFFLDTCGNLANVYDSSQQNNPEYWRKIKGLDESCNYEESNADSPDCGNCDYYLGSTCAEFETGLGKTPPDFGDYICQDLSCEWGGEDREHGETWCVSTGKEDLENNPGARHYRLLCYNGEVIEEPCAEFRAEVCIEDNIETGTGDLFSVAACRVNRWQDCVSQSNEDNCENKDIRDCQWLSKSNELDSLLKKTQVNGICVPEYAPGFDFYEADSDAGDICELGNQKCVVEYERELKEGDIIGAAAELLGGGAEKTGWKVVKNAHCLTSQWKNQANLLCTSLGDCGASLNYLDYDGYYDINDLYDLGKNVDEEELKDALKK